MKKTNLLVYALRDPRDKRIRYIGKTMSGLRNRMQSHLGNNGMIDTSPRAMWIKELLAKGLKPEAEVVEYCTDAGMLGARERHWIEFYAGLGLDLLNVKDGGSAGGRNPAKRHYSEEWGPSPAAQQLVFAMVEHVYTGRLRVEHGNVMQERPPVRAAGARDALSRPMGIVRDALDALEQEDPLTFEVLVGRACGFSPQRINARLRERGEGIAGAAVAAIAKAGVRYVWDRLEGVDTKTEVMAG